MVRLIALAALGAATYVIVRSARRTKKPVTLLPAPNKAAVDV
jgi:hypothetical protein